MNSALLECRLLHHRFQPREHRFANRLFFFALDLAEVDGIARRLRLFSHNRANLYSFRDRDFLPAESPNTSPLFEKVRGTLKSRGIAPGKDLRVILITIPRVVGYLFNPVSFYFCRDGDKPLCAMAEVTNTFREVKLFPLPPETLRGERFSARLPKEFYVSPFTDSGGELSFSLRYSGGDLSVRIDEYENDQLVLHTVVAGSSRRLNDATLAWFALKYPVLSLQVIARIHSQALRLYLKRIPWWRKTDQLSRQRNYHAPEGNVQPPVPERPKS